MIRIILASKSPRRIEILKREGIKFDIIPSDIEEISQFKNPSKMVKDLALKKAEAVSLMYPQRPVLSADTVVYVRGKILGKPKDPKDALRLLKIQNGRKQSVFTGVCLLWKSKNIKFCESTRSFCYARKLTIEELKKLSIRHLDKAGAYAVQDEKDYFIKRIEGDFDNVVGLPMRVVRKFLKKAGIYKERPCKKRKNSL